MQGEHNTRAQGGQDTHHWPAYGRRRLLQLLPVNPWLEICELVLPHSAVHVQTEAFSKAPRLEEQGEPSFIAVLQVEAFEESQKYKEGKVIIEKAKVASDQAGAILE